jgi:hypothetical protein
MASGAQLFQTCLLLFQMAVAVSLLVGYRAQFSMFVRSSLCPFCQRL